jgi:hypothetical protein
VTYIKFFDTSKSLKKSNLCLFHGRHEDDKSSGPTYQVSQEKARSLGIAFIPLEVKSWNLRDLGVGREPFTLQIRA